MIAYTFTLLLLAVSAFAELQFNVTALGARKGRTTIECWEVNTSFDLSTDHATAGSSIAHLGDVSSMSLGFALPGQEPEPHSAPSNQYV